MSAGRPSGSRSSRDLAAALVAALVAACGARDVSIEPAAGLALASAASRGVLSYAVAFADRLLVSVELGTGFELVTRSLDPASGRLTERARFSLGPQDWDVVDLALVEGGPALVASAAGTVRALDLDTGRVTATWHLGAAATAVAVSPDGRLAATGSASGVVCLRRLGDGALLQCLVAHEAPVSSLDFDPAGRRLASAGWDGRVAIWSVPQLAAVAELDGLGSANQVAFAPDGRSVAIAASGAPPRRTPQVASREQHAPAADPAARVLVWRPGALPARELRGHGGPVTAVAWSGRHLLSASWDRTVRLWDAGTGRELSRVAGFSHLLRDVAVARGGSWAAAAAWAAGPGDPATVLLALRHPP
ncbi:MAG TPA: hypothetical protein VNO33_06795 [Kofleriaceae bacterium]|nr:hypothetical protein [Kofleriaceae bacterium]